MKKDDIKTVISAIRYHYYNDVGGIIAEFTYDKCCECKEYIDEYVVMYNNDRLCNECIEDLRVNICRICRCHYILKKGLFCMICRGHCNVFCNYCVRRRD